MAHYPQLIRRAFRFVLAPLRAAACDGKDRAHGSGGLLPSDLTGPATKTLLLVACLAVAAACVTFKAWNMFGPSRRPMLQGWDDSFYYFWLPSVIMHHDLDFSRELLISETMDGKARETALAQQRTPTGLLPNKYPPGWAIGSLPFFLAAMAISPPQSTGFEPTFLLAVWLGQMAYAALGLWVAGRIVRRLVPGSSATAAVLVIWLASPLVYYQTAAVSQSHSQVFVLAVVMFWLALHLNDGDRRYRVWVALGFYGTLMVVTRNVAAIYLCFPAAVVPWRSMSGRELACLLMGALPPAALQMVAWKVLYGDWIVYSYSNEHFDFFHPHLVDVLFSANHGWFYWHPLILVGLLPFAAWALVNRIGRPWIIALVAAVAINASWWCWWLGSSFGHRGFEVGTFFAMAGFALILRATPGRPVVRRVLAGTATVCVVWNLGLLALFLSHRIAREGPVTYGDAVRAYGGWASEICRRSPP